jgi:hypothetical protein
MALLAGFAAASSTDNLHRRTPPGNRKFRKNLDYFRMAGYHAGMVVRAEAALLPAASQSESRRFDFG